MTRPDSVSRPEVSIIVPARNEEASLGACLQSLVRQEGVTAEIIVVDDNSTDRTRQVALSFPGVRVIDPGPLPPGWTGKNHAVTAGARQARGEWLLFTDADTVHLPGSLARALHEARQYGAALLSYSPEQDVRGFWQKAVMPVIFAELALTYPPRDVCDPASPIAAANGQYLLIRREAYDAVGGHAAVHEHLLEDVALAKVAKASGSKLRFRYGADAVRTRMYRNFSQLQEGWTKNLAVLFPEPDKLAIMRLAEFVALAGSAGLALTATLRGQRKTAVLAGTALGMACTAHFRRIRKAHFSGAASLLSVIGLPIFSYLLLRSRLSYKRGPVQWKGRSYTAHGPFSPAISAETGLSPVFTARGAASRSSVVRPQASGAGAKVTT